jgi:hypothetical protein
MEQGAPGHRLSVKTEALAVQRPGATSGAVEASTRGGQIVIGHST